MRYYIMSLYAQTPILKTNKMAASFNHVFKDCLSPAEMFLRPACPLHHSPSLVFTGQQWDQEGLVVPLLPVLLLVLKVQHDPLDLPVVRRGRVTLVLHISGRLLLLLALLYRRGHYVIKEGEEAIDPIRALLS